MPLDDDEFEEMLAKTPLHTCGVRHPEYVACEDAQPLDAHARSQRAFEGWDANEVAKEVAPWPTGHPIPQFCTTCGHPASEHGGITSSECLFDHATCSCKRFAPTAPQVYDPVSDATHVQRLHRAMVDNLERVERLQAVFEAAHAYVAADGLQDTGADREANSRLEDAALLAFAVLRDAVDKATGK